MKEQTQENIIELETPKRTIVRVLIEDKGGVPRFVNVQKVVTSQKQERFYHNPNKRVYQGNGVYSSTLLAGHDYHIWVDYEYHYESLSGERIEKVFCLTPDTGRHWLR